MSIIKYNEKGYLTDHEGKPVYIVGINYVASYVCTNFWEDWRPEVIEKDLKKVSELGLNAVRIPMFWGYMEPEQGKYNAEIFTRFDEFVHICKRYGLYIMPWFLAGVATRDYDVPFRSGRPFFTGEMAEIAGNHLKHFISRYKDEEQILFWDICDEPEWYSRHGYGAEQLPFNRKVIAGWVKAMYDAIKSVDPSHLVTLGFGHICTANYGMHIKDMAEILDVMSVTCYPGPSNEAVDRYRNNYFIAYFVKFSSLGKPVFTCEAPGYSSILYSEEIIGRYYKTSLYSNLINGSTGVMPWVFNDFDESIWHECPLDNYTVEPFFGIVTVDGRLKPAGRELCEFARFIGNIGITDYSLNKAETAILAPRGYYPEIGNTSNKIYTSFLLAKGCSADVDFVWDDDDLAGYKLLIIPTSRQLTTPAWDNIRKFVERGGVVYYIYDNRGGLNAYFNTLFGVEVRTAERDFGFDELIPGQDLGSFVEGESVGLPGNKSEEFLNVKAVSAEIIFEFNNNLPAVLKNRYGKGMAFLAVKPLEDGLLDIRNDEFLQCRLFDLYGMLMDEAGVTRKIKSSDPRIEIGCMTNMDTGELLLICINHDSADVDCRLYIGQVTANSAADMKVYGRTGVENPQININDDGRMYFDSHFEPAGVNVYKMVFKY